MKILGQNPNNNDSYEAEAGEVDEDFIEKRPTPTATNLRIT